MFGKPPQPSLPDVPAAPPPPPMMGQAPIKKKGSSSDAPRPTILGSDLAASPSNTGQKTLLGQ